MDRSEIPLGFGMTLAMNEAAMKVYTAMTEPQKQAILDKAHHAQTKMEMQQIVDGLAME